MTRTEGRKSAQLPHPWKDKSTRILKSCPMKIFIVVLTVLLRTASTDVGRKMFKKTDLGELMTDQIHKDWQENYLLYPSWTGGVLYRLVLIFHISAGCWLFWVKGSLCSPLNNLGTNFFTCFLKWPVHWHSLEESEVHNYCQSQWPSEFFTMSRWNHNIYMLLGSVQYIVTGNSTRPSLVL